MEKQYVCLIYSYNGKRYILSEKGEDFKTFKTRARQMYPFEEGWSHRFSEFKELH